MASPTAASAAMQLGPSLYSEPDEADLPDELEELRGLLAPQGLKGPFVALDPPFGAHTFALLANTTDHHGTVHVCVALRSKDDDDVEHLERARQSASQSQWLEQNAERRVLSVTRAYTDPDTGHHWTVRDWPQDHRLLHQLHDSFPRAEDDASIFSVFILRAISLSHLVYALNQRGLVLRLLTLDCLAWGPNDECSLVYAPAAVRVRAKPPREMASLIAPEAPLARSSAQSARSGASDVPEPGLAMGMATAPSPSGWLVREHVAVLAPELLGRLAAPSDRRVDIWMLGQLFYRALAGAPPITMPDDATFLDQLHAVLTAPIEPLPPNVPAWLTEIVVFCLGRLPTQRYTTAMAVAFDLTNTRVPGRVGAMDALSRFQPPTKLYARAESLAMIRSSIESTMHAKTPVAVSVRGPAGIGKTRLVREAIKQATTSRRAHHKANGSTASIQRGVYAPVGHAQQRAHDQTAAEEATERGVDPQNTPGYTGERLRLAWGKYESSSGVPLAALSQVLNQLFTPLLQLTSEELHDPDVGWILQLRRAIGVPAMPLIAALVEPEVRQALCLDEDSNGDGDRPFTVTSAIQELLPAAIVSLFDLFATPETALMVFLDDVHCCSSDDAALWLATLTQCQSLSTGLVILFGFRDEEGEGDKSWPSSPLRQYLLSLDVAVTLRPLKQRDVYHFCSQLFRRKDGHPEMDRDPDLQGLTSYLYDATGGNPFALHAVARALYAVGVVSFHWSTTRWVWSVAELQARPEARSASAFIRGMLKDTLDASSQRLLATAAAVATNGSFALELIAFLAEVPLETARRALDQLVNARVLKFDQGLHYGLRSASGKRRRRHDNASGGGSVGESPIDDRDGLSSLGDGMSSFGGPSSRGPSSAPESTPAVFKLGASRERAVYLFAHDRFSEAAFSLVPDQAQFSYDIGRRLLAELGYRMPKGRVLHIIAQRWSSALAAGHTFEPDELYLLGRLNIHVGRYNLRRGAPDTALAKLLETRDRVLPADMWGNEHFRPLAWKLAETLAETYVFQGAYEDGRAVAQDAASHARGPAEALVAGAWELRQMIACEDGDALNRGHAMLEEHCADDFPDLASDINEQAERSDRDEHWRALAADIDAIKALADAPVEQDDVAIAAQGLLQVMSTIAYMSLPPYGEAVSLASVELCRRGLTPASCYLLSIAGVYLCSKWHIHNAIDAGIAMTVVARQLVKRFQLPDSASVDFEASNRFVEHLAAGSPPDKLAVAWNKTVGHAIAIGAWETAAYGIGFGLHTALFSNLALDHCFAVEDQLLSLRSKTTAGFVFAAAPLQVAIKLGKPQLADFGGYSLRAEQLGRLEGSLLLSEDSIRLVSKIGLYRLGLVCCELLLAVIFNQPGAEMLERARADRYHAPGGWLAVELSLLEVLVVVKFKRRACLQQLDALDRCIARMTAWAKRSEQLGAMLALMIASRDSVLPDAATHNVLGAFDHAIQAAHQQRLPLLEAIASERAAQYVLEAFQIPKLALGYLHSAVSTWSSIGAVVKARALQFEHAELRQLALPASLDVLSSLQAQQPAGSKVSSLPVPAGRRQREHSGESGGSSVKSNDASSGPIVVQGSGADTDMATLIQLMVQWQTTDDESKVARHLLRTALQTSGSTYGALAIASSDSPGRFLLSAAGTLSALKFGLDLPLEAVRDLAPASLLLLVARTRKTILQHSRMERSIVNDPFFRLRPEESSYVALPVISHNVVVALVYFASPIDTYTSNVISLITLLATSAVVSIRNTRLLLAQRAERKDFDTLVARRTAMATAAQTEAESANASQSRFLAAMSHELRTPLNSIIVLADLLADTIPASSPAADTVNTIQTSSRDLLRVIGDVLDYAKLESKSVVLERRPFNVRQLVEDIVAQLADSASNRGIEIVFATPMSDDAPPVLGDAWRLKTALTNLCSNAIKFTAKGGVYVTVSVQPIQRPGSEDSDESPPDSDVEPIEPVDDTYDGFDKPVQLHFRVTDTGMGIDEQAQARIFKAFEQADDSSSRLFGGTGLGLPITKTIAELMAGDVYVDSRPGMGSVFHFRAILQARNEPAPLASFRAVCADKRCLLLSTDTRGTVVLMQNLDFLGFSVLKRPMPSGSDYDGQDRLDLIIVSSTCLAALQADDGKSLLRLARARPDTPLAILHIKAKPPLPDVVQALPRPPTLLTLPVRAERLASTLVALVNGVDVPSSTFAGSPPAPDPSSMKTPPPSVVTVSTTPGSTPAHRRMDSLSPTSPFGSLTSPSLGQVSGNNGFAELASTYPLKRMLVVEDNLVNQQVARKVLQRLGYREVEFAENGRVGFQKALQLKPEAVLMDLQMPVLDGVGSLRLIRENMPAQDQPFIIALTASAMRGDREKAIENGFDAYLSKPLVLDELTRCLREAHNTLTRRRADGLGKLGALGIVAEGSRPPSAASGVMTPTGDDSSSVRSAATS